jgi:hypothetical protein
VAERNLTSGSQIGQNSTSPEYHYGRKLSQLSDGLQYSSKQSAIYDLRLLELNRSVESEIWTDYTFQHKSGVWQNFSMTSPETLNTKFAIN